MKRHAALAAFALVTALFTAALTALLGACKKPAPPPELTSGEAPDPLAPLRSFEEERRRATSFVDQPVQDRAFGPDPYDLVALPDGGYAGILRGRDVLVVLDAELHEIARVPTPRAPSAIALHGDGVIVASELEPVLARYRVQTRAPTRLADIVLPARTVRAVTSTHDVVHVIAEHQDQLIELGEPNRVFTVPKGPIRLVATKDAIFVLSLIDHAITAYPLDGKGHVVDEPARVAIDGPFWSIAADGDLVVAGGVEDHPLDRRGGFFGYVDSFVYGYRYANGNFTRRFAIDVGEQGLIVPKAIALTKDEIFVTSYGGAKALRIDRAGKVIANIDYPPGATALANGVAANPLLDAWVTRDGHLVRVGDSGDAIARTDRERLGEALFFTGLMAPASSSDGAKSRFSCETCHFEGYVDGRTHHTGRGDVHATTKPLVGLFNNRPHFSRALDPDLSAVAENELRVAGAPSPADPHFAIAAASVPWLGLGAATYDATEVRRALMAFLMTWTHRTNPSAAEARPFTPLEATGAAVFRDRCESCHEARTSADVPASRVAFADWEARIFRGGPIVWGTEHYEKTGVVPYVHENGARVPSLRRLYKKRPYFTNGSAPDLATALAQVRFGPFSHAGGAGGAGTALTDAERTALLAFLDLL